MPPSAPADHSIAWPATFDTAIRGYDRQQVDDRLQSMANEFNTLRYTNEQSTRRAQRAEEELRTALTKLKQLGNQPGAPGEEPQEGFGFRVEKMLRMAEMEVSDIRAQAAREAAALVERARADAEAHRHEVEQSLISRSAQLDQETAQRHVELTEREQAIADQLGSIRAEAEQLLAAAQREAAQLRKDAETQVGELRRRAEQSASRQREKAEHELSRLSALHKGVRAELGRLHEMLVAELAHNTQALTPAMADRQSA